MMKAINSLGVACSLLLVLACGGATTIDGDHRSELDGQDGDEFKGSDGDDVVARDGDEGQGQSAAASDPGSAGSGVAQSAGVTGEAREAAGNIDADSVPAPIAAETPVGFEPDSSSSDAPQPGVEMPADPDPATDPEVDVPQVDPGEEPGEEGEVVPITPREDVCPAVPQPAPEAEIARRLERLLWDTDGSELGALLDANALTLASGPAVAEQAARMLEDERAVVGVTRFLETWLELDVRYTEPDEPLESSVLESTERALSGIAFGFEGAPPLPVKSLFTGSLAPVDTALADFYGSDSPVTEWELVELPAPRALGLLTQTQWLRTNPNPVWRGAAVRRTFLCTQIPPPPAGLVPTVTEIPDDMTTRDVFQQHQSDPVCAGCHSFMDPIGFGFEHFDAQGAYRAQEAGFPIDATGEITDLSLTFYGPEELAALLTGELAPTVETCLMENMVRHATEDPEGEVWRPVPRFEPGCLEEGGALPEAGLDASFQAWVASVTGNLVFSADYR